MSMYKFKYSFTIIATRWIKLGLGQMTTDTDGVIYSPESDQHKNKKKPGTYKLHLVGSYGAT